MRSRCEKFVDLMLNFARVNPDGAYDCLFAVMTDTDPRSRDWLLIVRAMRQVERQESECCGR